MLAHRNTRVAPSDRSLARRPTGAVCSGAAVLVISEDLDELFAICDCLAVLAGGRLSDTVPTAGLALETVGLWMTGEFQAAGPSAGVARAAV